jgi:sarcosine oxidase subunit beta
VTPRGLLSLAFSEVELDRLAYVAASGAAAGVPLWMVPPREARALLPDLAPDTALPQPLCSALWQPGAALVDGDAVVWGFARMAAALGADIVEDCAATELVVEGGRVRGVRLSGKVVEAGTVVVAAAEAVPLLDAAGIALPLAVRQRHVFTLAAGPPFLDVTVEASLLGGVASRSRRGSTVLTRGAAAGAAPWDAAAEAAGRLVALLPAAGRRGLASAAAVTTATTPDGAPILGPLGPDGLWAAIGWDDQEVAAAPAAGAALAAAIEEGDPGPELAPFAAARFASGALLDERPALEPA